MRGRGGIGRHPIHGETANARWKLRSLTDADDAAELRLELRPRIRRGRVEKIIRLPHDHDAIYQRHIVSQMSGPMNFGHHAMIRFPDESNEPGSGVISTSPFVWGQVFPGTLERPEKGGYSMLAPGATFSSLARVPTITGQNADLTRYPARRGF